VLARAVLGDNRRAEVRTEEDYRAVVAKLEARLEESDIKIAHVDELYERSHSSRSDNRRNSGREATDDPVLTIALNHARWDVASELHTPHPANLARTSHYPLSLSSLLPNHGLDYIGALTAMLYVKHESGGDFPLHVEQGYMPFVNTCLHGVGIWYFIPPEYEVQLLDYIQDVAIKHNLWSADFNLANAPAAVAHAIIRSRSLMPDPYELASQPYNIPVRRLEQEPGDTVIGHGYVLHMGTGGTSTVVSEAINAVPVWWLQRGLPQLLLTVDQMTSYYRAKHAFDANPTVAPAGLSIEGARQLLSNAVAAEFYRLIPIGWFRVFVRVLLYHVRGASRSTDNEIRADEPGMSFEGVLPEDMPVAERRLKELEEWLYSTDAEAIANWSDRASG
jgi:hypothetical protein